MPYDDRLHPDHPAEFDLEEELAFFIYQSERYRGVAQARGALIVVLLVLLAVLIYVELT